MIDVGFGLKEIQKFASLCPIPAMYTQDGFG